MLARLSRSLASRERWRIAARRRPPQRAGRRRLPGCPGCKRQRAEERAEVAGLGAQQEYAEQHQHRDVGEQGQAMRKSDADVMVGQEGELDVEQQRDGEQHQRDPGHAIQEGADDAAALRPRHGLHEEEVVERQAQGMRAPVGVSSMLSAEENSSVLRVRAASWPSSPRCNKHDEHRRQQEEAGETDLHSKHRQGDVAGEQQIAMGHARPRQRTRRPASAR